MSTVILEPVPNVDIVQSVTADSQAADGPTAWEDDDDEDTDVDDRCERRPVSARDAMNALVVLRDWLATMLYCWRGQ